MKRIFALFLALLFILTACSGKKTIDHISVQNICCPYEINHIEDVVEITLSDGDRNGIQWQVTSQPEDICQVTQDNIDKDDSCRYRVSGNVEGAAELSFTALEENGTACFVLTVIVNVDSEGKTTVSTYQHTERKDHSVEEGGLQYHWNTDINGTLNFSLKDQEDNWSVTGDGADVFVLSNMMSTPVGCKFSAQAKGAGQATIVLVSQNARRTVHVIIQADDEGNIEVISVQEQ